MHSSIIIITFILLGSGIVTAAAGSDSQQGNERVISDGEARQTVKNSIHFLKVPDDCATRPKVKPGKFLLVNFEEQIAPNSQHGEPGSILYSSFHSPLGIDIEFKKGTVLDGWLVALDGICAGAMIEFILPPSLSYQNDDKQPTLAVKVHVMEVSDEKIEPPSVFGYVDKNNDGLIDHLEFTEYFKLMYPEQTPPYGLFYKEDVDGDGFLTFDEFTGPKEGSVPTTARTAMDRIEKRGKLPREKSVNLVQKPIPFKFSGSDLTKKLTPSELEKKMKEADEEGGVGVVDGMEAIRDEFENDEL